uniref:Uncharacterized protein n=1 Tax=Peronospora matthiolae TaxID=2874970 RepID=A0AAV1UUK2_9STRA
MTDTVCDEDDGASRALEPQAEGPSSVMMKKIVSCISLLSAASPEHLTAENCSEQEEIVKVMTRVIDWLHREIAAQALTITTSDSVDVEDETFVKTSVRKRVSQMFMCWHEVQQKTKPLNRRLWMLWMEMGCSLEVLRCCEVMEKRKESCVRLMMTSPPPWDFPTLATICDKEKQGAYCQELWDATMVKPLDGASSGVECEYAPVLVEVFVHWTTAAMRGYELVFIANVAAPLRKHLHSVSTHDAILRDAWFNYAKHKRSAASTLIDAGGLAVTIIVLSALALSHQSPGVVQYLESLEADTLVKLSSQPFPQVHSPVGIVAMALGLTVLDDTRHSSDVSMHSQPGHASILSQFALLRLVNLPLVAPRLQPRGDATIAEHQTKVHQWARALTLEPSHALLQECSLRMAELCIEEFVSFFQTSLKTRLKLIEAMQSVLPTSLFRRSMSKDHPMPGKPIVQDKSLLLSTGEIVRLIRQFYTGIAPILEALAVGFTVRSFVALSRIEFAREVCASEPANASMQAVTQQLEEALEKTALPPDQIFAPVLHSVAMHSVNVNTSILPETDIASGCQALAVGRVVQRKLRILLFQCAPLVDDALSVVFSVLYNIYEPADTFGHDFIGICLSHLTKFIPRSIVLPHYLQVTLASYPANASPRALIKACGVIFGSFFYSETRFAVATKFDAHGTAESTRLLALWAIRKCFERSTALLVEEEKAMVTEDSAEESTASNETGGMYLAGLVFDLMKIAPADILASIAMEAERLLSHWKHNPRVLRELKRALFTRISQNCEAETRAWFAAWYIEVDRLYPVKSPLATRSMLSRL